MKSSKTLRNLGLAVAGAALTFSLAVSAEAQTLTVLSNFNGRNAYPPDAAFVQGTNGNLYNVSMNGGKAQGGNAFSMTPSGTMTTLHNFCLVNYPTCADGLDPSDMILGTDGNFYGTTSAGGTSTDGVIFKMTPGGKESTLYTLCAKSPCSDGGPPWGIVQGIDGNFYGATTTTIFKVTPSGIYKVLFTLVCGKTCSNGWGPTVPPIQGSDGNFYGTTSAGANHNSGVVYEITPGGTYTVLHHFCSQTNCTDGTYPTYLVEHANGNLYGIARYGGASGNTGTIFKITPNKKFSVVHTFDVANIPQSLIIGSDGNFYGTVAIGGAFGGKIFEMTPEEVYTELYQFDSNTSPELLMQATDGLFYGTTASGGTLGYGEAFSFSNNLAPFVRTMPSVAKVGQQVLILGNNLTGTSSVTFNGIPAVFTVESDTYIRATVPAGAAAGMVSVETPSGTLSSNPQFVVTK